MKARWTEHDLVMRNLKPHIGHVSQEPGGELRLRGELVLGGRARARASCPTEHEEQKALIEWAAANSGRYPQLQLLSAVPNGGIRHPATAGRLKAEGVRAGYPDLLLDAARGGFHGLRIEMKRRKGGKVTKEQTWWLDRLNALGYCAKVCHGADEAKDVLLWYLGLPATRARN